MSQYKLVKWDDVDHATYLNEISRFLIFDDDNAFCTFLRLAKHILGESQEKFPPTWHPSSVALTSSYCTVLHVLKQLNHTKPRIS
jgi:hypothetical protein